MSVQQVRSVVVASLVLGFCLPLLAEQAVEKPRRPGGQQGLLNEDGRAIMKAHRDAQQEQRRAQAKARREAGDAFREALAAESDPYKQLDMLEARFKEREVGAPAKRDAAQNAYLDAYSRALAASGVAEDERAKIMEKMRNRQQDREHSRPDEGDHEANVLAEIASLRSKTDLTTEDVRRLAMRSKVRAAGPRIVGESNKPRGQKPEGRQRRSRPDAEKADAAE
jgi:hypothetical protein